MWLGMNNLAAAAQISSVAFLFILALVILEMMAELGGDFRTLLVIQSLFVHCG